MHTGRPMHTSKATDVREHVRVEWTRAAGFTIVELVVLVAVISILCAIGFPLYLSYSRAQETDSAARVVVVALNQARQLAVTRGISFSIETQTNPSNRMRFCSGTAVPCPGGQVYKGAETDGNGW